MSIEFVSLRDIAAEQIIELMNEPLLRKYMPLMGERFTVSDCESFVRAKEELWEKHGYGPSAFLVDGEFAGWGGLQAENGDADLALVLHPDFWGTGKAIYRIILEHAFVVMNLPSVTALLPPSRVRVKGLLRLGFVEEGQVSIGESKFIRYRLKNRSCPRS